MVVNQVYRLILMRLLVRFLMKVMFFTTCILNLQQVNKMVILKMVILKMVNKMVNKMVILLLISLLLNQVILMKHPQVLHSVLMLHLPMMPFQMNKCNLNLLS
ncbi:hypothetical protein V6N12_073593 [Hibiscus sabdariffa]|uniref:Uncharacterized protein n=1 Tax=Hibiscus sabdariffa TaxID=183260 RepID=A0ABR2BHK9_9ROSI